MTDEKGSKNKVLEKFSGNYWIVSTLVLAIIVVAILIYGNFLGDSSVVSANVVGQKVIDFAKEQGVEANLVSVEKENGLYKVLLSIEDQEFPVYVTLNGENLVPSLVPLETQPAESQPTPTPAGVPKSDKPVVELFVMTHCPYGTQAEKGFIPFMEAMGDKVDTKIRFVHYFMHEPEYNETPRQVCIREEQSEKFIPYLKEFLKEGNPKNAIISAKIDESAMNKCIESGKWEDYYAEDSAFSQAYGVSGSPTLVVNGVITQGGRSPASYLSVACSSFNEAPEECNQELSNATPKTMWGWDSSGATNSSAQC
jgi:glutaredoxin